MADPVARTIPLHGILRLSAVLALLLIAAGPSRASQPAEPRTWWIELAGGVVQVQQSGPLVPDSPPITANDTGGFFKIGFGNMVNDQFALGLEVSASFLRSGGSREDAITLLGGFVTGRVYPVKSSPFHLRLAGGTIVRSDRYTDQTSQHVAWEAGVGYDLRLRGYNHLTPFVAYQSAGPGGVATHSVMAGAAYGRW